MAPMADMIDALGTVPTLILSSRARRTRSVCVVALKVHISFEHVWEGHTHPKGSPTTKNATSTLSASFKISSLALSTISRSAMITSRP